MERAEPALSGIVAAVARRPSLWWTAVTEGVALVPRGWWRRWPPLPRPDRDYLRFRVQTQYGDPDRDPTADDVITWLKWCRQHRNHLR